MPRNVPEPSAFPLAIQEDVRFVDCDPMGHVNNAVYLSYLEMARGHFWRYVFGLTDFREIDFVLAHVSIDYLFPATVGMKLTIYIRPGEIRRSSFEFHYLIYDHESRRAIVSARTIQVMFDYKNQKPKPLDDVIRKGLEKYQKGGPAVFMSEVRYASPTELFQT